MDEEFTVFELRSWDDYIKLESKMNWRCELVTFLSLHGRVEWLGMLELVALYVMPSFVNSNERQVVHQGSLVVEKGGF